MNEITGAAANGNFESAVTTDRTTNTNEDIESDHHSESETTTQPVVNSVDTTEETELPLDITFELLRNQRRRYVLQYLERTTGEVSGEVSLSELAEQIAAWEHDKEIDQITSSERKRVYVGLYQCHLPKMDGMGVISFNKPRGLIELGEHAEDVQFYVQRAMAPERPSRTHPFVGLSVVGATMLPVAIILSSQSILSLGVAMIVTLVATVWGVTVVQREGPTNGPASVEPKPA